MLFWRWYVNICCNGGVSRSRDVFGAVLKPYRTVLQNKANSYNDKQKITIKKIKILCKVINNPFHWDYASMVFSFILNDGKVLTVL